MTALFWLNETCQLVDPPSQLKTSASTQPRASNVKPRPCSSWREVEVGAHAESRARLAASNTYREGIAAPALRAGRAALDSILSGGDLNVKCSAGGGSIEQ